MSVVMYTSPASPTTYVESYVQNITSSDVDLSTMVSAVFKVKDPNTASTTWTASLSWDSTAKVLTVWHPMTNELTTPGTWSVFALLTDGGGLLYAGEPKELVVLDRYDYSHSR